jgi:short-subunit dehydrogenase
MAEALVMPIAISPSAAIRSVKNPSEVQVWECATESVATPFSRAAASASGKARSKAGWAKPNRASTRTQPGAGRDSSGSTVPSTRPLRSCTQ